MLLIISFTIAASARWSAEVTNQRSAPASYTSANPLGSGPADADGDGAPECWRSGYVNNITVPGRPRGGWYEWRFGLKDLSGTLGPIGAENQFIGIPVSATHRSITDVTRLCPVTFNEYTTNHFHGAMSVRLGASASPRGALFAAYDSISGYYWQNRIKVALSPADPRALAWRPYTEIELSANPRLYVTNQPGSRGLTGLPNQSTSCPESAAAGPQVAIAGGGDTLNSICDAKWRKHQGTDHEGTPSAPPAMLQTYDPDIDFYNETAFVTWTEHYIEGTHPEEPDGFDATSARFTGDTRAFPYNRLAVHAARVNFSPVLNSTGAATITYISPRNDMQRHENGLNNAAPIIRFTRRFATSDAVSPRIVGLDATRAQVVWGESATPFVSAVSSGRRNYRPAGSPDFRIFTAQREDTSDATSTSITTSACNIQTVSSGQATGYRELFTGIVDIGKDSTGNALIAYTERAGSYCVLKVKRKDTALSATSTWTQLGTAMGNNVSWPRITYWNGAPYVVYVDGTSDVRVARFNGSTWVPINANWNPTVGAVVRGPSIAVMNNLVVVGYNSDRSATADPTTPNGVFGVQMRSCTLDASGTCSAVTSYHDSESPYVAGGEVYGNAARAAIGISDGVMKTALVSGVRKLSGYDPNANAAPAATDLTVRGSTIANGETYLAAGWVGPVGNHRYQDRGVYVKIGNYKPYFPINLGRNHSIIGGRRFDPRFFPSLSIASTFGANLSGQLGTNSNAASFGANDLNLGSTIAQAAAGMDTSVALTEAGALYFWGDNANTKIHNSTCTTACPNYKVPQLMSVLPGSRKIARVSLGITHLLALATDGTVWGRGINTSGQLGNGTFTTPSTWVQMSGITNAVQISAGGQHSCVVTGSAQLYCVGENGSGQVGVVGGQDLSTPVLLNGNIPLANFGEPSMVAAGGAHTVLVTSKGNVFSWGDNSSGQLGLGDMNKREVPTITSTIVNGAPELAAGTASTYVLDTDSGELKAAGSNSAGQLGNNSQTPSTTLISISLPAPGRRISATASSLSVSALVGTSESLSMVAWGANSSGQLGVGHAGWVAVPTAAMDPATFACANPALPFQLFRAGGNDLYGCQGVKTFIEKDKTCKGKTASSADWLAYRATGTALPSQHYWTTDLLRYNGTGSGSCSVSTITGNNCGDTTPMRLCAPTATDSMGNTCNWLSCGYESNVNQGFGGCSGNTTAGSLCKAL